MQAIPVKDGNGKPTGEWKWDGSVANKGLELLGKSIGLFAEKNFLQVNVDNRSNVEDPPIPLSKLLSYEELQEMERRAKEHVAREREQKQLAAPGAVDVTPIAPAEDAAAKAEE